MNHTLNTSSASSSSPSSAENRRRASSSSSLSPQARFLWISKGRSESERSVRSLGSTSSWTNTSTSSLNASSGSFGEKTVTTVSNDLLDGLDHLIHHSIRLYTTDSDLLALVTSGQGDGLVRRLRQSRKEGVREEQDWATVLTVLTCFLQACVRNIPPSVVYQVHSLAGMVHEVNQHYELAISSHLKALWIVSSSSLTVSTETLSKERLLQLRQLAGTLYRLAMLYGYKGDTDQAYQLLTSCIVTYGKAKVHKDYAGLVEAKRSLHALAAMRPNLQRADSLYSHDSLMTSIKTDKNAYRRLGLIREDTSTEEEDYSSSTI